MESFELYLLILGLLLAGGALLSGLAHRSILSLAVLFLGAGIVLGGEGMGILSLGPGSETVKRITELTLIVILFVDGLEVEMQFVKKGWHLPLRSLLVAMPLTAVLIAVAAAGLLKLDWRQAFLLGALLSPTDPVLTASVVTNPKIPARIRHSLNLESGLNDGLALPAVLIFAVSLLGGGDGEAWWEFLARDISTGAAVGLIGAFAGARVFKLFTGRLALVPHYQTLYAFAVALSLYGAARLLGGNGLIAVYLAGIVMANQGGRQASAFPAFSRDLGEVLKLATFVIFGSLLVFGQLLGGGVRDLLFAAFVLFAARTLAFIPSTLGTGLDWPSRFFMAWFGPRGVACIAYTLLVLNMSVPGGERIFNLAALVVFGSVILHSASDTPLANWFGSRASRKG